MKHTLFFILFIIFAPLVFCQENREVKNEVGLFISDLINGTYSFTYERAMGKHISVGLGFGIKADDGFIKFSGLDTDNIKTADISYTGFKITPEVRYYIHQKGNAMFTGFYFGAYTRLVNYKTDLSGIYIDSQDVSHYFLYKGDIDVNSVGFMIGYKLPVTNHLKIDFLIAGPGAGYFTFKLKDVIPPPDEFYDDLNSALEKYSFLDFLNADFQFKKTNLKEKLTLPSFRYGLSVTYSF
ncbi:DUF3575 domain-containing protein [Gaetbulibacter aquiaggeris]|uniref:DUF3575 domain-containing protein n=1 Tax=Gaetbulibacter aquiaggeris TaxID=1735373 RepID=A0ABW7MKN0_9FLAO